jgi:uncharacterized protein GlcG (DUF336 family)
MVAPAFPAGPKINPAEDQMNMRQLAALAGGVVFVASIAHAQVPQYGTNVTLEQARKAIAAAEAEARKNSWPVAIAIVDTAGMLVLYQKADNTQTASIEVSQDKAISAAIYRRTTKVMQGAGVRFLNLRNASVVEGGLPLTVDGKIIGAIGVSGVTSEQDGQVAAAGVNALK